MMDAAREEEEVRQRLRDAAAVCEILTPVLRQMSEGGKAATARSVPSVPDMCALELGGGSAEQRQRRDRSLDALNIVDRRLLSNLVEHTRQALLLAELPQLSGMSEGGLQLLANGDAAWGHGDARRVRAMSLKACRRMALARRDEELLATVIKDRIRSATALSAEQPLKGLSEVSPQAICRCS